MYNEKARLLQLPFVEGISTRGEEADLVYIILTNKQHLNDLEKMQIAEILGSTPYELKYIGRIVGMRTS
jgi:hypothetical protein